MTTTPNTAAERLREAFAGLDIISSDLDAALAAERRATVEAMEREGVVQWADDTHKAAMLDLLDRGLHGTEAER